MSINGLISLLKHPQQSLQIDEDAWNGVIAAGRQVQMLGQLAACLANIGATPILPWRVRRALSLALLTAEHRRKAALWEVGVLRRALHPDVPIILLKGSAYAAAGDCNSDGRLFSDIDVLVPRKDLDCVEHDLIAAGWKPSRVDAYDQRYYREWMHEIPPMEHVRRHTTVDLHHAIVPRVSRYAFPPKRLIESAVELSPGILVLCPSDRAIHCALHAFLEGVSSKALRDLYDFSRLLSQHFSTLEARAALQRRAAELGVADLVSAACSAAIELFDAGEKSSPRSYRAAWLALAARQGSRPQGLLGHLSYQMLLAHSHWMKMPWSLLIPHLARKTYLRWQSAPTAAAS